MQRAIVDLGKLVGLLHSVTDASLVFDDKGKVYGPGDEPDFFITGLMTETYRRMIAPS